MFQLQNLWEWIWAGNVTATGKNHHFKVSSNEGCLNFQFYHIVKVRPHIK